MTAGTPDLNRQPRSLSMAQADLDRDALINFDALARAARGSFAAGDLQTARSKLRALIAVVDRVESRRR